MNAKLTRCRCGNYPLIHWTLKVPGGTFILLDRSRLEKDNNPDLGWALDRAREVIAASKTFSLAV